MQKKRPVFLNLWQIKLPVTALTSILHRVSGVVLVLALPLLVYLFDLSLRGEQGFAQAVAMLDHTEVKLFLSLQVFAISHHLSAGLRHLLLDLDLGVQRGQAIRSAWLVNAVAVVLAGGMLWGLWSCAG